MPLETGIEIYASFALPDTIRRGAVLSLLLTEQESFKDLEGLSSLPSAAKLIDIGCCRVIASFNLTLFVFVISMPEREDA